MGRIIFTRHALPSARPVNHVLDDIDRASRTSWNVVTTGHCRLVTDPGQVARCQERVSRSASSRARPPAPLCGRPL
ncbi:hypothetical protein ACFC8N_33940 [Streptomyces sp. NPDC055966]|uniref:hypothetical protein n=1 Tax=Streptomyces sp. NPDC055966 TaxID=3345669 RepID=UPI0035E0EB3A